MIAASESAELTLRAIKQIVVGLDSAEAQNGTVVEDSHLKYVALVSEVEAFVDQLIEQLAFAQVVLEGRANEFLDRITAQFVADSTRSWDGRMQGFRDVAQIKLGDFPDWSQFMGVLDARNALTHGLGRLTRKQIRTPMAISKRLQSIGISVDSGQLQFGPATWALAVQVCSSLVTWLDQAVQAQG